MYTIVPLVRDYTLTTAIVQSARLHHTAVPEWGVAETTVLRRGARKTVVAALLLWHIEKIKLISELLRVKFFLRNFITHVFFCHTLLQNM